MSLTTLTIGVNTYTSYATIAEADAALAVSPSRAATWSALTADQKATNLVAATNRLDLESWTGDRTNGWDGQANEWPRTGVTNPDGSGVSDSEVPLSIEQATAILAGSIALDPAQAEDGTSGSNIKILTAGSVSTQFFRPTQGVAVQDETVFSLIKPYLASSRKGSISGSYASGTCQKSRLTETYNTKVY